MSSNTTGGAANVPPPISNDQLAANLQKCAILVKKGEKDPLIRETIHDLTYYLTGKRVRKGQQPQQQQRAAIQQQSPASTVSKHTHVSLGGVLGKMVGLSTTDDGSASKSESSKAATSVKNAARVKAEVDSQEWCETHFTRGCACKTRQSSSSSSKPGFQRPSNPTSALVANGWIEQQRRSKMRTAWKEVLASLVEGRKPGEETTLWIQREVYNSTKDKTELEALHQIPIKWLQEVTYCQYSTDHRFILKVFNLSEEFIFRCSDQEAAQNWVLTLRSMQEIIRKAAGKQTVKTDIDDWEELVPKKTFEDEKKVPEQPVAQSVPQNIGTKTPSAPPPKNGVHAPPQGATRPTATAPPRTRPAQAPNRAVPEQKPHGQPKPPPPPPAGHPASDPAAPTKRMTVSELRAIAHGAGIVTHGMERDELERVALQISLSSSSTSPTPPAAAAATSTSSTSQNSAKSANASTSRNDPSHEKLKEEAEQRRKLAEAAAKRQAAEEEARKQQEYVRQQQATQKRMKDEEERKRLAAERERREEEEHRRRVAGLQATEQRRREEEQKRLQQQKWQQQQQQWQAQQAADAQRQQAAAEERRRQEEVYRAQQQQWFQQQHPGVPPQQQWQQHHQVPPNQHPPPPQHQFGQQQQQYAHGSHGPHPGRGHPPPPPSGSSPVNMKYAKMAAQTGDGTHMTLQTIKHGILVEWALQPPAMQVLRPIEQLLSSIHTVFPPKFGVAAHEHFTKWNVVRLADVMAGAQPDDEKLKKAVRKLRFFLHPDRQPRDFSEEQKYMCKMLWDISSDAYDDHNKREEELGWMRN